MKKLYIIIYTLLFILAGCDYVTEYTYCITNETDYTITLKANENVGYKPYVIERIYKIYPFSTEKIHRFSYADGRNENPRDKHSMNDTIPASFEEINVYADNILISSKLMQRKYWNYTTNPQEGMYELLITDELLESMINR